MAAGTGKLGRRHRGGRARNANGNDGEQAVFAAAGQADPRSYA